MDRKQLIGLVLIFLLFYVWSMMNSKSRKALEEQQRIEDSIRIAETPLRTDTLDLPESIVPVETASKTTAADSLANLQLAYQYGIFAPSAKGEEKEYVLENEHLKITFSSKGGFVKNALLKDYFKLERQEGKKEVQVPLYLLEDSKNKFRLEIPVQGVPGNIVRTDDLYYQAIEGENTLTFRAITSNGGTIDQIYSIEPGKYDLGYTVKMTGIAGAIEPGTAKINLNWINYLDRLERNYKFEKFYSTVYFKEVGEDSDYCNCRKDAIEEAEDVPLDWVSNANQFFNTSLLSTGVPFSGATLQTTMLEDSGNDLKMLTSNIKLPYTSANEYQYDMLLYLGPNDFNILRGYERGLEEVIPFGRSLFGGINRWVIRPFFNFLDNITGSKGMAIILMIFLIKLILYPLTYKMLYSQAKMGALKPEIEKIKDKYKEDPQQLQVENMKLYREYGVSPLGGCMPMILQMPIWYALFRFFPASIDFRQESFLWATDLSSYDVIAYLPFEIPAFGAHISLFTVLWAISTVAYTYYSTKHVDMSANPAMKYVQYFMPLMFLFFFNNYASGLTAYMFFSNLFNIGQTIGTKRFVFDEEKIRAQILKNKEKPKKTSKFQARLQETLKQQQALQEAKNKAKKK